MIGIIIIKNLTKFLTNLVKCDSGAVLLCCLDTTINLQKVLDKSC